MTRHSHIEHEAFMLAAECDYDLPDEVAISVCDAVVDGVVTAL